MKFDQTSDKIADRVRNLRSSAVRDLFAAAVRPDIISLSGGMPDVSLLPQRAIQKAVHAAITDERAVALQYGSTNGRLETRQALCDIMRDIGVRVKPEEMLELDRWAVTRLNALVEKCAQAYNDYEFLVITHAVNDFCVVTLSSLYLDIIKDRLYCDGADSAARRSAQSALWIILDAMTKVFAPILAFTCDEIWLQMPHRDGDDGRNVLLNQMSKPYADYALSDAEMAVWETALHVRSDVNGVLETARADKRIGKSLEAHVALTAVDTAAAEAVTAVAGMNLAEIFIVSNVAVTDEKPEEGAVVGNGTNFPGLTVAVTEAKGTKCPRCWMHSESPDEHGLCPRCAAVCKALGVVFE